MVVAPLTLNLAAGTYSAKVVFSSSSPVTQRVELPVTLAVSNGLLVPASQVQSLTASSVADDLAGSQARKVLVWGRGFGDLAEQVGSWVLSDASLKSYALTGVTRLGAGLFQLDAPALPAGRYELRANNALGVVQGVASLQVLEPVDRTAASIAMPSQQSLSQAQLNAFVLDPARATLLATSRDGLLHSIDPKTFTVTQSVALGGTLPSSSSALPLALTGDGLAWVPMGGDWATLSAFNLKGSTLQVAAQYGINVAEYSFYLGPWALVSGNGRRMLMPQSGAISPTPVMLWRDASGGLETAGNDLLKFSEAAPYKFFYRGSVDLPLNWTALSAAVSPDGSRTYVYALGPGAVGTYSEPSDPGPLPRIYVFDSSTPVLGGGSLPQLGYMELDSFPACRATQGPDVCEAYYTELRITDDARSLLVLGDRKLMLVPISSGLRPASARAKPAARALALRPLGVRASAAVAPATGGLRDWSGAVRSVDRLSSR